ncbi:MAG: 50S ribosomal protein L1 [Chloroflexi bacterium]|nr:50S ribosomal protein L1 [Chloroflexota bacterium]
MAKGKRFTHAMSLVDRATEYPLAEAIALSKQCATARFDETIELHLRLGIDPRHSDQQVRSTVMLPNGTGKEVRILVFAEEGEDLRAAEAGGADHFGADELIQNIQNGWLEFDATIAVPSVMRKVGRVARILGPRGLMPSPKAGTVVQPNDIERAVRELKAGRVEFRNDRTGNLHIPIGKASFAAGDLQENAEAVIRAVQEAKPSGLKGTYLRRIALSSTMGPGIRVEGAALN